MPNKYVNQYRQNLSTDPAEVVESDIKKVPRGTFLFSDDDTADRDMEPPIPSNESDRYGLPVPTKREAPTGIKALFESLLPALLLGGMTGGVLPAIAAGMSIPEGSRQQELDVNLDRYKTRRQQELDDAELDSLDAARKADADYKRRMLALSAQKTFKLGASEKADAIDEQLEALLASQDIGREVINAVKSADANELDFIISSPDMFSDAERTYARLMRKRRELVRSKPGFTTKTLLDMN